jgi:hypothetical protein
VTIGVAFGFAEVYQGSPRVPFSPRALHTSRREGRRTSRTVTFFFSRRTTRASKGRL